MCHRKQAYIGKKRDWMIFFFSSTFFLSFLLQQQCSSLLLLLLVAPGTRMTAWVNEGTLFSKSLSLLIFSFSNEMFEASWNLIFFFFCFFPVFSLGDYRGVLVFWQTVAIAFPPTKTILYQFYYDTKVWWKMNLHLTFHVVFLFPELFLLYLIVFPAVQ